MSSAAWSATWWVGLGSFISIENAERFRDDEQARLGSSLVIRSAETSKGRFYRVLAGPFQEETTAREAVSDVRALGIDAWLVVDDSPEPVRAEVIAQPSAQEPDETLPLVRALPADPEVIPPRPEELPEQITLAAEPGQSIVLTRIDTDRTPIRVDGYIDEAVWREIPVIDDFVVLEPDTLTPGIHATRLRVAYAERGMYISAEMDQPEGTLLERLSGRDVRDIRDSVSVTIDTSGEGRYGFWFGINLGDALMDGTVLPERKFTSDWDGPWHGRTQRTDKGWSMEMFIPWGIVSMPAAQDERHVGIYVSRMVAYLNERWGWPALPPTQPKFMSALQDLEIKGVNPGQQYNIYPFAATSFDWIDDEPNYRVGADVFWRPSTNFQLNATVNPDFGNVESDDVIINLTATETFFPEKRLFFLEGQDIFVASPRADTRTRGVGNTGAPYTMVNTRRIGGKPRAPVVGADVDVPKRELIQQTELMGAVKTTGQFGRMRYGVMGAFEEEVKFDAIQSGAPINLHQDGNDYGIARLLYEDNAGGAYRAIGMLSTAVLHPDRDAIVHGLDAHYLSPAGNVKVDAQAMRSDIDGEEVGYGGFIDFELTYAQGVTQRIGLEYFDEHVDINDLGFLQRNDHYNIRSSFQWTKSDLSWARENQFDVRGMLRKNITEDLFIGGGIFFSNRTRLNNLSTTTARLSYFASSYDDLNSFGNGTYRVDGQLGGEFSWESDTAKEWSYSLGAGYQEEDLGAGSYNASAGLTWRPIDRFALELSARYSRSDGWLLHQGDDLFATFESEQWTPKFSIEYYISARQQLRLALQWVGIRAEEDEFYRIPAQPDDLISIAKPTGPGSRSSYDFSVSQYSLQARYRWEIAPLSDIFLVYTRQADLRTALDDAGFNDLFDNAWQEPLADILVFKIRYRFGS